ncbi:major facilitator superfamily domain-containing protein 3 isoform X2 [Elgaria multicarinata webbii]|uniref:major facilitator superfamily domain-containing protein 3 isoform X2 n=1 Tax=Elgaria multicarinata webbii TaxID=159646 RepID=UPI002FCD12F9
MKFKYVVLGMLYFVQGIPYGLQSGLLPIYFRTLGLSFTKISLAKVLYTPWILKDIAADGVAIRLLGQDEVGYGNTVQVVAYKLGSVLAGGGLLTFLHRLGWGSLFVYLAAMYTLAIVVTWNSDLRLRRSYLSQDRCVRDRTFNPWHILQELLQVPDTLWTAGFVLIYKLGEQGSISMFPLFLLERDFSAQKLGFWNGIVAMIFSIVGSSLGGHLISKQSPPLPTLKALLALRACCLVFQILLMVAYKDKEPASEVAAVLSICVQHFIAGLITTLTFSMMMYCTQKAKESVQATHYSFLATLEVLGKLVFSTLSGSLVDWLGFTRAFGVFFSLSFASIVYLLPVRS